MARAGFSGVDGASSVEMVQAISLAFPAVTFVGRGVGEDMGHSDTHRPRRRMLRQFGPFEASAADALNKKASEPLYEKKRWWKF